MSRPNWRSLEKVTVIILLFLTLTYGYGPPAWADTAVYEKYPHRLVLGRAPGSLRGDIEYLRRTWGPVATIAVVTAKEQPMCRPRTRLDGSVTEAIYCWIRIQYSELLDGNPENRVQMHYWYLEESEIVNITPGTKILVFLALAVDSETYICTVMMRATEENLAAVRAALREIDG